MQRSNFQLACYAASSAIIYLAGPPTNADSSWFILVPLAAPALILLTGDVSPIFDCSLASLSVAAIYEAGTPTEMSLLASFASFLVFAPLVTAVYETTNRPSLVSSLFMTGVAIAYGDFQQGWLKIVLAGLALFVNYVMLRFSATMAIEQRQTVANTVRLVVFIVSVDAVLKGLLKVSCGYLLALPDVIWLFTLM